MGVALNTIDTVLWGVITFSILVVFHEMGHFLAARAFGVRVHEFMIGLPGPALRFRTKDMAWGVTAIPLGGYVRIAGMEPGPEDPLMGAALVAFRDGKARDARSLARELGVDPERAEAIVTSLIDWKAISADTNGGHTLTVAGDTTGLAADELAALARSVTYRGKPTWQRITILAMGVITNIVVAVLTFTLVLSVWGYDEYSNKPQIGGVAQGSAAEKAGLESGDTLVAIDGTAIDTWDGFQTLMTDTGPSQTVLITITRDGDTRDVPVTLGEREGHGFLGVEPSFHRVRMSVGDSLVESVRLTGLVFKAIFDLFNPRTFSTSVQDVRGVVGISIMAAEAAAAGPISYAALIAMLSLSLGVMNLLPMPPLDGGKVILEVVERIVGRPLSRTVTLGLSAAGAVLLFSLIGFVLYADIARIAG